MAADFSIARWAQAVPSRQWSTEAGQLAALQASVPEAIVGSRALSEVHRLDLALFVVFEESALRVSGALVRKAPTQAALQFAAQQTLDEAHHFEIFQRRSDASRQAAGLPAGPIDPAILTPPLRRFIDRCYEVADTGSFVEGLALTNLVLEGMAYPLYAYEEAYWAPIDPYLARLVRGAFTDETRHVHFGAQLVRELLAQDPAQRARVARLCHEARDALAEVFQYYVRTFVGPLRRGGPPPQGPVSRGRDCPRTPHRRHPLSGAGRHDPPLDPQ